MVANARIELATFSTSKRYSPTELIGHGNLSYFAPFTPKCMRLRMTIRT